jgi:hypothetical protein
MLIPCAAMYQHQMERRFLPTINLQMDLPPMASRCCG